MRLSRVANDGTVGSFAVISPCLSYAVLYQIMAFIPQNADFFMRRIMPASILVKPKHLFNVANVEVLPIPTTFAKATAVRMLPVINCFIMPPPSLEIEFGHWQHFHNGNISANAHPTGRFHSADRRQSGLHLRSYHTDFMPILYQNHPFSFHHSITRSADKVRSLTRLV